jgi:hypothetical protein
VNIEKLSFRWGLEHAHSDEPAWVEIQAALSDITRRDIISKQLSHFEDWIHERKSPSTGKVIKPPVGAQSVLNDVIADKIKAIGGWDDQIYVLNQSNKISEKDRVPYWTMDFRKNHIGLEVSFNNAGVFAQNLLRLSVMSESKFLAPEEMIKLGVLVVSSKSLKNWGKMDSTVITFDQVETILPHITFSIPTPIVIIGIENCNESEKWAPTKLFGNKKIGSFEGPKKSFWEEVISEEVSKNK